jgi:NAD(P)-dependent dehydrogenase (short-subunit alcohol dehydrogenase family)
VDAAFGKALEQLGRVDILVNNAGLTRDGLFVRMSDEQWDQVLDTNLAGAFRCSRAVARSMMKARYGRIVNISSVVGLMGNAGQANYAASKAGLLGLTKALARELASASITVNAVCPGYHRHGDDRAAARSCADGVAGPHPAGPPRFARGRRGGRRVPRLSACGICHRPDLDGGRRHGDGVNRYLEPTHRR